MLQQVSTTREAERYKIHPAKPRAAGKKKKKKKNENGKGLEDSRSTHTKKCKQGDGGARRATTQPGAPGPVPSPKKFSFRDSFEPDGYNYFVCFGYRGFSPFAFQGLLA